MARSRQTKAGSLARGAPAEKVETDMRLHNSTAEDKNNISESAPTFELDELDGDPTEIEKAYAAIAAAIARAESLEEKAFALEAYARNHIHPFVDTGKVDPSDAQDRVFGIGRDAELLPYLRRDGLESIARCSVRGIASYADNYLKKANGNGKINGRNGLHAVVEPPDLREDSRELLPAVSWWVEPASIPPREFLFGKHYSRGAIGGTIGAPGRAKTTLGCCEAVSMAIGRDLLTGEDLPDGPLRVWMLNGEEPQHELDRRLAAVCQHYAVTKDDLGGRLFVHSLRKKAWRLATIVRNAPTIDEAVIDRMAAFIRDNAIDVFMIDPLVSFHKVAENDNVHMDVVIKDALGLLAENTNTAGEVFHHPGKPKPGATETTVDDARGASAIIAAVRSARVLNIMSQIEAEKLGIADTDRRRHIRITNGKANMGPIGTGKWMRIEVENLANGDQVAVASSWTAPDPFQTISVTDMHTAVQLAASGEYRADSRSPKWFGYALAKHLSIPVSVHGENDPKQLAKLKAILKKWLEIKVLDVDERNDVDGKKRKFVVPGANSPTPTKQPFIEDDPLAYGTDG
jgi:hypothetical protein